MEDAPPPPPLPLPPAMPALPRVPRATPPARRPGAGWKWFALACVLLLLGSAMLNVTLFALRGGHRHHRFGGTGTGRPGADELEEVVIEDNDAKDKIAVLDIDGVISSYGEGGGRNLVDLVRDQLDRARHDDAVQAVLLRVDSPGGEVLASDEIYLAIRDFQETTGKPVVASMGSLAASGGYYVSAPCQWIVANELTITGSIGVIFHNYNYRALMDKVGVRPAVTKSGRLKDMWSGEKRPEDELPEEQQIMQSMINESFTKFKKVVKDGRERAAKVNEGEGRPLVEGWESLADGRVMSGNTAFENGFVDELGNFDTAVDRTLSLVGLEKANLVGYAPPPTFGNLLRLLGKTDVHAVKVDLGLDLLPRLPQGRLYFLSPVHLQ